MVNFTVENGIKPVGGTKVYWSSDYNSSSGDYAKKGQQDRYFFTQAPFLRSKEQAASFLRSAYGALRKPVIDKATALVTEHLAEKKEHGEGLTDGVGTTAVTACQTQDKKLVIANMGDSRAVLFVRDPNTKKADWIMLTHDHDDTNNAEKSRAKGVGGEFIGREGGQKKLRGLTPLTRSLGCYKEKNMNVKGILAEPEITWIDLNAPEFQGKELYLLVSCDGLYECQQQDKGGNYISKTDDEFLQAYADQLSYWDGKSNIAKSFTEHAKKFFLSHDNLTALFARIVPGERVSLSVFDGHGKDADQVSQEAAKQLGKQVEAYKKVKYTYAEEESEITEIKLPIITQEQIEKILEKHFLSIPEKDKEKTVTAICQIFNSNNLSYIREIKPFTTTNKAMQIAIGIVNDIPKIATMGNELETIRNLKKVIAKYDPALAELDTKWTQLIKGQSAPSTSERKRP